MNMANLLAAAVTAPSPVQARVRLGRAYVALRALTGSERRTALAALQQAVNALAARGVL
jgi:hypothetical protein